MRTLLQNKLAFGATVLAFVLASGLTAVYGTVTQNEWPEATLQADDPSLPPFPWCPTCAPPERSEELAMDDPSLPPFPWCPTCAPPEFQSRSVSA